MTDTTCKNGHVFIPNMENKCMQCVAERNRLRRSKTRESKMISIDHLLGLKRDEQEFIDVYYYEDFV